MTKVKGVRDLVSREAARMQEAMQRIRTAYELFGFEPLETPAMEYLALFTNKSGAEIEEQLYSFEDKKGEKLALRPELTVSRLRVVAENKQLPKPYKAYSIGKVWRYEDVAKGRYREFTQADVDIYGSKSIRYDAEIIACIDFALKRLGVPKYTISINNRKVLNDLMKKLEISYEDSLSVFREMDKINKVGEDNVRKAVKGIIGEAKSESVISFIKGKLSVESDGNKELNELLEYLKDYGIKNAVIDSSLVRGIAYYDGNVFEFILDEGKSTIASGGRYDTLSEKFDISMPIVGCSIGVDRVLDFLKAEDEDYTQTYCVINIDSIEKSLDLVSAMRKKGFVTDIFLDKSSLSKGLDYCNGKKIRYAVIVGKKDLEKGEVTVRDMKEHADKKIRYTELAGA